MSEESRELLTTVEAASRLGFSRATVVRLCEDGRLIGAYKTRPGGHWRVPLAAVEQLKAANRPAKSLREAG
jgi:excisionase family DNA binding protein